MSTGVPSSWPNQVSSTHSGARHREIHTAPGVQLSPQQRVVVESLLEVCSSFVWEGDICKLKGDFDIGVSGRIYADQRND
jgi:hypothetical protein